MKKLTAILLIAVFLVNLVGYRAWFYFAEEQWNKQQEIALNHSLYNEEELIVIKVPLRLPYVPDTKDFRRTDGEINVNGRIYRYVKSKVENGEYVLLCLPDHYKQQLQNAKHDFFKFANDIDQDTDSKKGGSSSMVLKLLICDYENSNADFASAQFTASTTIHILRQDNSLVNYPHLSPAQPPDFTIYC